MGLIEYEYAKAINQAKKIEEAAKRVRDEAKRFETADGRIKNQWTGDNATKFAGKMRAIVEDLNRVASNLEKEADVIRKVAKRIRDADTEAAREAMRRNHS